MLPHLLSKTHYQHPKKIKLPPPPPTHKKISLFPFDLDKRDSFQIMFLNLLSPYLKFPPKGSTSLHVFF